MVVPTQGPQEWLPRIEKLHSLVKPHLGTFTLKELGSLRCLYGQNGSRQLSWDSPEITGDERFSLRTQGIFQVQPWFAIERIGPDVGPYPDGKKRIWGITQFGLWVLAVVSYTGDPPGREKARTVEIKETVLSTIITETKEEPQEIWRTLCQEIKMWVHDRTLFYQQALQVSQQVEAEERALSLI